METALSQDTSPSVAGGFTIQSDINVCALPCSGGLRPPSSIGDRRYNPGAQRAPLQGNAQELMSFCIVARKPVGTVILRYGTESDLWGLCYAARLCLSVGQDALDGAAHDVGKLISVEICSDAGCGLDPKG